VLVKFRHDVFAAVYSGRGAILVELRDAMTAKPGHIVFVDNFGMSRVVVIVVVVGGQEERFEVCHDEERDGVLFFSRWRILTYNSRGRDTGLAVECAPDRKECEFRELLGWQKGGGNCYTHMWNDRVWTCVPLNWTCWLCARNGVLWCLGDLRAAEDLRGAVCLFRD